MKKKSVPPKLKPSTYMMPAHPNGPWFPNITDEEIESLLLDFCPKEEDNEEEVKCECGADKTYKGNAPSHSHWCPKAE